jgi:hypothetical protein
MNVKKLDSNCYYYTDLFTQEEQSYILKTLEENNNWTRIYDRGQVYDPDRVRDIPMPLPGLMIAYRKEFNGPEYKDFYSLVAEGLRKASEHYAKDRGIKVEKYFELFNSVDKHCPGTVYGTHIDTCPVDLETYSILFYLNDNYEGGEISFSLPSDDKKIEVVNGNLQEGPNGLYPPDHEKNIDLISFWLKPKACSILIFPPLRPHMYPHTAHEIRSGDKYLIKGHWPIENKVSSNFVNNPYVNDNGSIMTEEEIIKYNPGAKIDGIVPDEYKKFYI